MKILPECYLCALRQALAAARLAGDDEGFHVEVMRETSRILADAGTAVSPPSAGSSSTG